MPEILSVESLYALFAAAKSLSTDTRQLSKGQLFVALKGELFDANDFVADALARGAASVLTQNPQTAHLSNVYYVPDTLGALHALAAYHRKQLVLPIVAITGSNGKTTTKELLRAILSVRGAVYATPGNRNNAIGVPLCLLELTPAHTLAVLELGDNHPGEIDLLAQLAAPTHGLITNLGEDHLEGYGSMAANAQTKRELFVYLAATEGHIFRNDADPWLCGFPALHSTPYNTPASGYTATVAEADIHGMTVEVESPRYARQRYELPLVGRFQAQNLLAAVVIAEHFGYTPADIREGVRSFQPGQNRGNRTRRSGITFWQDAYNANPSSVALALEELFRLPGIRPGIVLGEMRELGSYSADAHQRIGKQIAAFPPVPTVFLGPEMAPAHAEVPHSRWYARPTEAKPNLLADLQGANFVLVKGSRGLALEQLLTDLPED